MNTMRKKNTGTFDETTGRWRIKAKKISKTPRELGEMFGVELHGKTDSLRYWNRFVASLNEADEQKLRQTTHLKRRLASIDDIIASLEVEGRDTTAFVAERSRFLRLTEADDETADVMLPHPDIVSTLSFLGKQDCEATIALLNPPRPRVKVDSLRREAEAYIANQKTQNGRYQHRRCLDMLLAITGDITIHELHVEHWRALKAKIDAVPSWGPTTKHGAQRRVIGFLRQIERDHSVTYGFSRGNLFDLPDGQKIQWTLEQLREAARTTTGVVRSIVLMAANAGFYEGDITTMTAEMFSGDHVSRVRHKLRHKRLAAKPSHLLWPETLAVQTLGITASDFETFGKWRAENGYPEHKAIRKGIAQLIQTQINEEAARLYRGEKTEGTHGKNYIVDYSAADVSKLDEALALVREWIFDGKTPPRPLG
jgi:hypothetical protein